MILTKEVNVSLQSKNIKHYESKGYDIPRSYHNNKKEYQFIRGTIINVRVCDLPDKSRTKILTKCDMCGAERLLRFASYHSMCKTCMNKSYERAQKISQSSKGKIKSEEHIQHIKNNLPDRSGSKHPMYNKHHSEETKQKIRIKLIGKKQSYELIERRRKAMLDINGRSKNYNYSISDEERNQSRGRYKIPGYYSWTKQVKEKYNNTCVKCKSKEHINIHHINNYKQFVNDRLNIDNGICLCKQCHKQIHHLFGLATNQDNLKEFLN